MHLSGSDRSVHLSVSDRFFYTSDFKNGLQREIRKDQASLAVKFLEKAGTNHKRTLLKARNPLKDSCAGNLQLLVIEKNVNEAKLAHILMKHLSYFDKKVTARHLQSFDEHVMMKPSRWFHRETIY